MKGTFSAVLTTLEEIAEGSGSDRVVEARGLLFQVNSFQFLLSLLLFERIFSITAKLSRSASSRALELCSSSSMHQGYKRDCTKSTKGN